MTGRWPFLDTGAKPRVLLVDDHRGVRDRVAAALARDFEVAGVASDGPEAIVVARECSPDVIVLDINMPGLDGYQTKAALDRAGYRAPVVFFSTYASEDHISEAFRRGGRGYVLKLVLARDLVDALHHVLHGRVFVPSLTPLVRPTNGCGKHAMQLYRNVDAFLDGLADFFDRALLQGDATCAITTPDIREGLGARLRARGWVIGGSAGEARYLALDTADALDRFMRNGLPDRSVLSEIASEMEQYRRSVCSRPGARLVIFGGMARALVAAGNSRGAMELERQWSELTHDVPFLTLCGYSTSCFDEATDLWADACAVHEAVSHAEGV